MHPDMLYDLKVTDTNWATAQREAKERGDENPIFTGAAGIWDGLVLHEHEYCEIDDDAGASSNVPWGKVEILGAQSLVVADGGKGGKRPEIIQEEFDYKKEVGYAVEMITGVARSSFNSLEFGSCCFYAARTNIAGLS
jgi:N4-gp56 family major capsid protein